ncbi:hypothetical protein BJ978_002663 [Agromyces terreus]|uniref:Ankyrin repeat domain-containing protein n=1 Tax=Agromyces terreus TaxID=424795 RepID=A0A9X2H751_9MICO|nr:ankyrin repeat domain-containing protein [Agromyces terreus]MCP2371987.1 hypothetical protein [Agromyces terreus]
MIAVVAGTVAFLVSALASAKLFPNAELPLHIVFVGGTTAVVATLAWAIESAIKDDHAVRSDRVASSVKVKDASAVDALGPAEEARRIARQYASIDAARASQQSFASRSLITEAFAASGQQWGLHAESASSGIASWVRQGAPIDGVGLISYGDQLRHWETPLLTAFIDSRVEAAAALIAFGADVDAPNAIVFPNGSVLIHTTLHMLAQRGDTAGAARLIAAGADVNRRTSLGTTALHFAAGEDNVVLVNLLLQAGANANIREFNSDRPGGFGDLPIAQAGPRVRAILARAS